MKPVKAWAIVHDWKANEWELEYFYPSRVPVIFTSRRDARCHAYNHDPARNKVVRVEIREAKSNRKSKATPVGGKAES